MIIESRALAEMREQSHISQLDKLGHWVLLSLFSRLRVLGEKEKAGKVKK